MLNLSDMAMTFYGIDLTSWRMVLSAAMAGVRNA